GFIDSVLVDGAHALAADFGALENADVALLDAAEGGANSAGTLAAHVRGPAAAIAILGHVLVAETLEQAHQRVASLSALAPYQSVITRGGEWLGPGWARVRRAQGNQGGVLAREREIRTLTEQVAALEARIEECTAQLDDLRTRKFEAERARDDTQRELYTHTAARANWPASCRAIAASWKPPVRVARRWPANCPCWLNSSTNCRRRPVKPARGWMNRSATWATSKTSAANWRTNAAPCWKRASKRA